MTRAGVDAAGGAVNVTSLANVTNTTLTAVPPSAGDVYGALLPLQVCSLL